MNEEMNGNGEATAMEPEDLLSRCSRYFPGMEVLGCCVIGTYPTARMKELTEFLPEAGRMIYHLQEQEESLYWLEDNQYRRIRGYFVFYEQNRKMQEYLADLYGEDSVEKESSPDKAILSFREKVKEKGEKRRSDILKIASSFFVVMILAAGAIVVNRLEDIRELSSTVGLFGGSGRQDDGQAGGKSVSVLSSGLTEASDSSGEASSASVSGAGAASGASDDTAASSTEVSGAAASSTNAADTAASSTNAADTVASSTNAADTAASSTNAADTAASSTNAADTAVSSSDVSDASDLLEDVTGTGSVLFWEADIHDTEGEESGTAEAESTAETEDSQAAAVRRTQAAYVIKEGDTLAYICRKYYGSLDRLEELCEANQIEDANVILPGQEIVLP